MSPFVMSGERARMPGTASIAPWQTASTAASFITTFLIPSMQRSIGLTRARILVSSPFFILKTASLRSWSVTRSLLFVQGAYLRAPELDHGGADAEDFAHVVDQLPDVGARLAQAPDEEEVPLLLEYLHLVDRPAPDLPLHR